jgi:hypothetical protein
MGTAIPPATPEWSSDLFAVEGAEKSLDMLQLRDGAL